MTVGGLDFGVLVAHENRWVVGEGTELFVVLRKFGRSPSVVHVSGDCDEIPFVYEQDLGFEGVLHDDPIEQPCRVPLFQIIE